ncbi:LysR family substrate-binding domain-containing protein [Microbacterium sediminis]|uniref:Transcriptional regulator n=1 Tax=Microbacterium sediminis TaxID=904291 RepID=A0A1B9NDQ2_9MICO|nr:LysR family substrate-binding domain-containing protein [Microbacterium sediminis]OCG74735.1 transcriptional regulator [Microbacterium sediminis]QBR75032.1 transcriptional regulator [Microbacterium sediminis]
MAKGKAAGGARRGPRPARPQPTPQKRPKPAPRPEVGDAAGPPRTFRLGAIPGAMPGKWIERWRERMPRVPLELVPIPVADQRAALNAGEVDAALVRLPLPGDADAVHVIRLYDEVPVVVAAVDSSLLAADELTADDLAGEVLITPRDDVLGPLGLPTEPPRFEAPETTEDAIAIVASGVGIAVMPMSLARLHHRRDVDYRPLSGGPASTVALAWRRDRDSDDVQTFVGITRGRTARSSR